MTYFDTSSYSPPSDRMTPEEAAMELANRNSIELAMLVLNVQLNSFIADADVRQRDDESPVRYMGWYWRNVDFFEEHDIAIADGDGEVRICQSNKWGYPQRSLTSEERDKFLRLIWAAHRESCKGGNLSEIFEKTDADLEKAFDYIGSLTVPEEE